MPLIGKLITARWVWAPYSAVAGLVLAQRVFFGAKSLRHRRNSLMLTANQVLRSPYRMRASSTKPPNRRTPLFLGAHHPMTISRIGVVGCGLMGAGITQVLAAAGYSTRVCEAAEAPLQRG
jgi:hypothetical protein